MIKPFQYLYRKFLEHHHQGYDLVLLGLTALLVLGGVLYTLGGVVYAIRKPDPWPRVFGYLEVFHLLVVAGSALHYSLVAIFVLPN